ncbi:hypothetical protein RR48_08798 [Papilio machaon]|uniref:Uncharacterized protein n=1 Tax=Papilio machaon TaxID=76193 RepID=A0A194RIC0_PAPMA|nr:hypothetical protein RR48_08798 [Papilio machaon]
MAAMPHATSGESGPVTFCQRRAAAGRSRELLNKILYKQSDNTDDFRLYHDNRISRGNSGGAAAVAHQLGDVMAASRDHDCSRFLCDRH